MLGETIRDRVVRMEKIKARDLMDHEGNWRMHPAMQKDAMKGILTEVGITDALLAYYSERNGGALTLVDGHLRKDVAPDVEWPVLVTDLDDDEADKVLLTFDPIALMAETNRAAVESLADNVLTGDLALREMIRKLVNSAEDVIEDESSKKKDPNAADGPPDMELQPFEHYDYVLLMCRSTLTWERVLDFFGIERTAYVTRSNTHWDGKKRKVGVGRVLDADKVLDMIEAKYAAKK